MRGRLDDIWFCRDTDCESLFHDFDEDGRDGLVCRADGETDHLVAIVSMPAVLPSNENTRGEMESDVPVSYNLAPA